MATESNINTYYEELINSLAERAYDDIKDNEGDDYEYEADAISQAIDDGLIYYADQAYIIAHAFQSGLIDWGKDINWDIIWEELYNDVSEELQAIKHDKEA